jgi:hypothetical protein
MAAAGYGDETTWESIFNVPTTDVDSTRFGNLNIHIGRKFNFYITGDSETDIVDTKVTGMLAAETHQLILELYLESKAVKHVQPWDAALIEMGKVDFHARYRKLIRTAQQILYGYMELVSRDLPSSTTNW